MKKILTILIFASIAMLSSAPSGSALYASPDPWPVYRHDMAHSGATVSSAPNSNRTLWTHGSGTGGMLEFSPKPIIVDGRVIYETFYNVYAVDETNGVQLWSYSSSGALTGPTYADGRVFFGIYDTSGGVVCLDFITGAEIWKQDTSPNYVTATPLVNKGVVYAPTTANSTLAFNATNGHYISARTYQTNGPIYSAPAAHEDVLFFGNDRGVLYALDVSGTTSVQKWNFTANGAIRSSPTISNSIVYFGSDNHTLYALNETTGELIWTWTTTDSNVKLRNGISVANNILYVTSMDSSIVYALQSNVALGNYTETDLTIRYWTRDLTSGGYHEPVWAGGKIIVTSNGVDPGRIYALDADVGNILWWRHVNWWPALGNPVVADGRLWFNAAWLGDAWSMTLYCIGDEPFPATTYEYQVSAGGHSFNVTILTNSTITDFNTANLETQGKISFNVRGIGTTGMCNITLPTEMMTGAYNVTVDGGLPIYSESALNTTHSCLYFTYNTTSQHTIEVSSTVFVPEFQPVVIAPMMMAAALLVALLKSRRIPKLH